MLFLRNLFVFLCLQGFFVQQSYAQCEELSADCVFPGDSNFDGVVNKYDIFNIGIGYGSSGVPRAEVSTVFQGYEATDWTQNFADGTNYKHADCNGDGIIEVADALAIAINYNYTVGKNSEAAYATADGAPPICIDAIENPQAATHYFVDVKIGTAALPANDIYGFAFNVYYDNTKFESINFYPYEEGWFFNGISIPDQLKFVKYFDNEGRIEVAYVRTDQNGTGGFGNVAYLDVVTIDNISGEALLFEIDQVRGIDAQGQEIPLDICDANTTEIDALSALVQHPDYVFSNPVVGKHLLQCPAAATGKVLRLTDMQGKTALQQNISAPYINIELLNTGLYLLEIASSEYPEKILHRQKLLIHQ